MIKALINGTIILQDGQIENKALLFDEKIIGIVDADAVQADEIIDAQGAYICPGLIDVHIHGYVGDDTCDASEPGMRSIAHALPQNGVTSFLPTTMTIAWSDLEKAFANVRRLMPESRSLAFDGAEILGCHAEGPFINPGKKGAQAEENIIPPNAELVMPHQDIIKIITMAPEMPGGMEFIKTLTQQSDIVVSIGHTNATFEEAMAAIDAGASHITHLFNAQTALNHRNPGVVGAALSRGVSCELICDTFHIHPGLYTFLYAAKQQKLVLVTDCTRAGGLPDGEYTLGGQPIFVKGIECRLADGTIAGSVLKLNNAVKNLKEHGKLAMWQAVNAASLAPAQVIGESHRKGSLEAGKDADITLMTEDCTVQRTFVHGQTKYVKGE